MFEFERTNSQGHYHVVYIGTTNEAKEVYYTIIMSRTRKVKGNLFKFTRYFHFFRLMYNKTIITIGFRDIQNNQGRGKHGYQPKPK